MVEQRTISYLEFKERYADEKFIAGYDEHDEVVLIFRKGQNRIYLRIPDFPYYFCVRKKDVEENKELFRKLRTRRLILDHKIDHNYVRIYTNVSSRWKADDARKELVSQLTSHKIETFEADLSPSQRLFIDHKLEVATEYRTLYFDIETDDRGKGIVIGARRIVSIAAVDDKGKQFYWSGDEEIMLGEFFKKIVHYDLLTGWNSEKFDVPYIKERVKKLKLPWYNWRQTLHVDMMQKMMEIHKRNVELIKEVRSFSLNSIAKHFLNEEKIEHTETIWQLFTKNPDKLRKYNLQDCKLLLKLDKKLKILGQKIAELSIAGCFLNEYAVSRILDVFILRNAVGTGIRFKTKPPWDDANFDPNRKAGYVGGLVLEPVKGVHYDVFHFDFTSLYPSIIQTFNISPETWVKARDDSEGDFIYSPNGQAFEREIGIVPRILTHLLDARNDIRYNELKKYKEGSLEYEAAYFKQYAFKTIANSFYGILGASFTRYYRKENAESITLSGHYLLNLVQEWCKGNEIEVIYGDTDSVFVKADYALNEDEIHSKVNQFIAYHLFKNFNVENSKIDLKVEAVYDSFLMVGKKKYVKNEGGTLKLVGLEAKRRETLKFTAKNQIKMIEMLLLEKASAETIIKWLEELKEYVLSGKMTKEEVMLQIKLSKHVDDYRKVKKDKKTKEPILDEEGKPVMLPSSLAHIKVANWLRENGIKENGLNTWEKGSYVKYIVIDGSKKLEATSIYNYEDNYDPTYYWDVKVYAPLQRVLEEVFPEVEWADLLVKEARKKTK